MAFSRPRVGALNKQNVENIISSAQNYYAQLPQKRNRSRSPSRIPKRARSRSRSGSRSRSRSPSRSRSSSPKWKKFYINCDGERKEVNSPSLEKLLEKSFLFVGCKVKDTIIETVDDEESGGAEKIITHIIESIDPNIGSNDPNINNTITTSTTGIAQYFGGKRKTRKRHSKKRKSTRRRKHQRRY